MPYPPMRERSVVRHACPARASSAEETQLEIEQTEINQMLKELWGETQGHYCLQ